MFQKMVCLLAPISLAVEIDVGSRLYAAELILPCLAGLIFFLGKRKIDLGHVKTLMGLWIVYIISQIFSDLFNLTEYEQYSRGWARIIIFMINLMSIYVIVDNRRINLILFACGFAIARVLITFFSFEGDDIPWKIGLAKPVALLSILLVVLLPIRRIMACFIGSLMLFGLGLFDILHDFRSHGLVQIFAAALLLSSTSTRLRFWARRSERIWLTIGVVIVGFTAMAATYQFYVHAAQSGWLSAAATRKFEAQVENVDVSLLVAGRSEVLVYFEAIADSFFVGHGSWPRDEHYAHMLVDERYEHGLGGRRTQQSEKAIPIHSHFFGSWIEAGIAGGLFWAYILLLTVRSVIRSTMGVSHMRLLYLYGAFLLMWDILFSPFSGFRRVETAFLIIVILRSLIQRIHPGQTSASRPFYQKFSKRRRRHVSKKGRGRGNVGMARMIDPGVS